MDKKIELLAPGGDIKSIKAAILAGADAVYCGLDKFNARNRAENISFNDLNGILNLAHKNNCEVFLTVNIIIVESELPAFVKLLNKLVNTSIDGVIVQDLGALYLLKKHFPTLQVHVSTQMTTHNEGQIAFLKKLSVARVNLSRELNIREIKNLTKTAHDNNISTEVFVHGANCISFSGLCYFSSIHGGNSGNRGRCSQQCRSQYATTPQGNNFPLNLKDNSAFDDLDLLIDAGVDSLKIEGRIKKFDYVYTVVHAWRQHLDTFEGNNAGKSSKDILYKVFNRDLSNGFLADNINKNMFIDNPRDNSARYLAEQKGNCSKTGVDHARDEINAERSKIIESIESKIEAMDLSGENCDSNNACEVISPVKLQHLRYPNNSNIQTTLSVIISSEKDLEFCKDTGADIYFQLPSSFEDKRESLLRLFSENKKIIPWFQPILIGNEFDASADFIERAKPELIVTNNTGIAVVAQRLGIPWIAGPFLNLANSYSLKCLKEHLNCAGAFISNELSRNQIGAIKAPSDFKLFYSIYHPIMLMTSRQCLFHTVTGCEKNIVNDSCINNCARSSSITNTKGSDFIIEKSSGNYHKVYNDTNSLNTEILEDMSDRFSSFFIDQRAVAINTTTSVKKERVIQLFKNIIDGDHIAINELKKAIYPTTNQQYKKGI